MQERCLGRAGKFKGLFIEQHTLGSLKSSCFDSSPYTEIKSHSNSIKKYKIPPQEMNASLLLIYIGFRFLLPTLFLLLMLACRSMENIFFKEEINTGIMLGLLILFTKLGKTALSCWLSLSKKSVGIPCKHTHRLVP